MGRSRQCVRTFLALMVALAVSPERGLLAQALRADGYRGIWWGQEPTGDEYSYKYSGGLGTYTSNHIPPAYYSQEANKTFFVYGGSKEADAPNRLLTMASYFDHATGKVPKPTIVYDKPTSDPHENPSIMLDAKGYVWITVAGRGRSRPGSIFKSHAPYAIDSFELMERGEFCYPHPWYLEGKGFLLLFTKYLGGRQLFFRTSPSGWPWSDDQPLVTFGGHYQVSWPCRGKLGTAFQYHPGGLVDRRTNLYYLETDDFGKSWKNVRGEPVETPLTAVENAALVHPYEAERLLVYLGDLNFDAEGRPIILYLTSPGWHPGPQSDPRIWRTAHWNGQEWEIRDITRSDHNYDVGCLHVEDDGTWRMLGATETGPQPYHTGGEVAMWVSRDRGATWTKQRDLTSHSLRNHTYVRRPVNAHPDFYAFWADGDAAKFSPSWLYFANRDGDKVWRLPYDMTDPFATPERVGE